MNPVFKPWENLTIADDFMFCKVMSYEEICKQLLEYMLHVKIEKLVYHEAQKSVDVAYDIKGIRLDVYVADSDRIFDVEMQTAKKTDLPKRARYYQSLIDVDTLKKGDFYTSLKESYIIFICTDDPFGNGLSRYTFRTRCDEKADLLLDDKITKVFYNVNAYRKESDKEVRAVLELIKGNKPTSRFTAQIQRLVDESKTQNERWRNEYMTLEMIKTEERLAGEARGITIGEARGEAKGITIGEAKGKRAQAVETAKYFLRIGVPSDKIAEGTGLTVLEVEALNK